MKSGAQGFFTGLRIATERWWIFIALYLAVLLPALLLAARPAELLWGLADRPVMNDIAAGMPAWVGVDVLGLLLRGQLGSSPVPEQILAGLRSLTWGILFLPLISGISSAFLLGGVLCEYGQLPGTLRWKGFLNGCWRWFGCYLVLGFFQAVLFGLGMLSLVPLALWVSARLGLAAGALALLFLILLWSGWFVFFEVTRVQAVAADTRNPFRAMQKGGIFLFRRFGYVVGFYFLALLVLLGLHGLFRLVFIPLVPFNALLPALLVQQAFILLRLLAYASRLAGLMEPNDPRL